MTKPSPNARLYRRATALEQVKRLNPPYMRARDAARWLRVMESKIPALRERVRWFQMDWAESVEEAENIFNEALALLEDHDTEDP